MDQKPVVIRTEIVYLMSHIAIADKQMLLQLMSAAAVPLNTTLSCLYEGLLDQWWLQVSCAVDSPCRV
jgi:hypothetical protein